MGTKIRKTVIAFVAATAFSFAFVGTPTTASACDGHKKAQAGDDNADDHHADGGCDECAKGKKGAESDCGCPGAEEAKKADTADEDADEASDVTLVRQPGAEVGDTTMCPVMGSSFTVTESSPFVEHEGQKVFFCCPGCAAGFEKDPAGLLAAINAQIDEANKSGSQ